MRARAVAIAVAGLVGAWGAAVGVAWLRVALEDGGPSRSTGTVAQGHLEHGRPIRPWGPGYVTYSYLGAAIGRQYVNGAVRDALVASFAAVGVREPRRTFVVGETGWPAGGHFRPHRTHQNGLSVDVFMPLVDAAGDPATPGTWPWNKFGYGLEFDEEGRLGNLRIDFEALAGFLREMHAQAATKGLTIQKIAPARDAIRRPAGSACRGHLAPPGVGAARRALPCGLCLCRSFWRALRAFAMRHQLAVNVRP